MYFWRTNHPHPVSLIGLLISLKGAYAFDCENVSIDNHKFDFSSIAGEHEASHERKTPPTTMTDSVRLSLCSDLEKLDKVSDSDQCPEGTRACLTKTNSKENESNRIVAAIPVAQTSTLNTSLSIPGSSNGLLIKMYGGEYPNPKDGSLASQSMTLTLLCSQEDDGLSLTSYDGSVLDLEWKTPAGCADKKIEPAPEEPSSGKETYGSGIGWFFLVMLLAFLAYLGLGAYYNYHNYGASGWDLLPHRSFWREVPYILKDLVSHLCSTVRPRHSSRGGYIAV